MYVDATPFVRDRISGLERYSFELLSAACDLRPELEQQLVFLAFIGDNTSNISEAFPAASITKLPIPRKVYSQFHKYLWPLHSWFKLSKPALYTNFFQFPFLSKKAMVVVHDFAYIDTPETISTRNRWALNRLVPKSINRPDATPIAVSGFTKRRMVEVYSPPVEPEIVANAVDAERFATRSEPVKNNYSLPDNYILFVGTVEPRKNLRSLIRAYDMLELELTNKYPLVIAGRRGWLNEELDRELSAVRATGKRIIETGYIADEDLAGVYQGASAFAFLSDYEGTGLPVLEAMASGVPVVASNIPPHRDISAGTVTLVDQHKPEIIANSLRELLTNPPPPAKLKAAQDQAAKQDWTNSAERLLKIIDKLDS